MASQLNFTGILIWEYISTYLSQTLFPAPIYVGLACNVHEDLLGK